MTDLSASPPRPEMGGTVAPAETQLRLEQDVPALRAALSRTLTALGTARTDRLNEHEARLAERAEAPDEQDRFAAERTDLARERQDLIASIDRLEHRVAEAEHLLAATYASSSWQLTRPVRSFGRFLRLQAERGRLVMRAASPRGAEARQILSESLGRRFAPAAGSPPPPPAEAEDDGPAGTADAGAEQASTTIAEYPAWRRRFDTPDATDLARLQETAGTRPIVVAVIVFTSESIGFAGRTLDALRRNVGLRVAVLVLFQGCEARDARGVQDLARAGGAIVDGLDELPDGTPLLLLEGGALPRPHGPRVLVDALLGHRDAQLAYADDDLLDADGTVSAPWFKPRFSARLTEAGLLLGRMTAARGEAAAEIGRRLGGVKVDLPSILRDVALVAGEARTVHVPHVLFHNLLPRPAPRHVLKPLPDPLPVVSVIIPTRNGWSFLGPCLSSLAGTDWPRDRIEVIVVDNGSTEPETLAALDAAETAGEIRVVRDPRPFNYAQLNNTAARIARGEYLALLNNDTVIRESGWLRAMVAEAASPGAGAVGAKLLYPDGTVQHGGVILGVQGTCIHAFHGLPGDEGGYMGLAGLNHEVAASTGACLVVRKDAFFAVGGLDERFRVAFNDIMLCLDLHARGLRNVYVANPLITHFESKTRGFDTTPEKIDIWRHEVGLAWRRHAALLRDDPCYSPNLSLEAPYALAFAPRRRPAWRERGGSALRVLMLSNTYARGHLVAMAITQHVRALKEAGHEVILAGHRSDHDIDHDGHEVVAVHDTREAAALAVELVVDVVVSHTAPFFTVARWTGAYPPVISYDYGDPPPDLFPDATARGELLAGKSLSFSASTRVLAISDAVASEAPVAPDAIVPLGTSHLQRWTPAMAERRRTTRAARGWSDRFIVLNRRRSDETDESDGEAERLASVFTALVDADPLLATRITLVLCGGPTPPDSEALAIRGVMTVPDISEEEMLELCGAADAYVTLSPWEGRNLGIDQASAMGLPVVASDIAAHRGLGVRIVRDAEGAAIALSAIAAAPPRREPRVQPWTDPLRRFIAEVEGVASGRLGRTHSLEAPQPEAGKVI